MKVLIVDCGTKHLEEIKKMVGLDNQFLVCNESNFSTDQDFDLVIVSGATNVPSVYYEASKHQKIIEFINTTDLPIFGICFGFELIGRAFGCELYDSGHKDIIKEKSIIFNGTVYEVFEAHRFGIKKVSEIIDVLGTDYEKKIEIIKHKNKKIIGTQFHPEVSKDSQIIFNKLLTVL